ncbi:MAG: C39 family peptidase [Bdellovibrionales bacterium]|nr:C39 family peptidase [Bdellovibrionales bacterium]
MNTFKLLLLTLSLASTQTYADHRGCSAQLQTMPLFAQETDYTCGPACARSLVQFFTGRAFNETDMAEAMDTYRIGYTPIASLMATLQSHGLYSQSLSEQKDKDLHAALRQGEAVILLITLEDGPHYVLLNSITPTHITLMDPWIARLGGYRTISLADFHAMWTFTLDGQTIDRGLLRVRLGRPFN